MELQELISMFMRAFPEEQRDLYFAMDSKYDINCMNKEFIRQLRIRDKSFKRYYYLLTFTLRKGVNEYDKIQNYIIQRLKAPALQIGKCHIVKEFTAKHIPHWHCAVISKKYLSKDRFKYYEKLYGFVDISKNHSQNYSTMMEYISKSSTPTEVV